jgi:predicted DNA-binding protein
VPDAEIVRPVIQMTREEWERIKAFADKDRMSRSEFVRLAIEQLMDDTCEALGIAHRIDSDLSKPTTRIWEATKRADLLEENTGTD